MNNANQQFEFVDPGPLSDQELEIVLAKTSPGDLGRGWLPSYAFDMVVGGQKAGRLRLRIGYTDALVMYFGHIGYDVMPEYRGHQYAERACRLILPLAKAHGLDTIWIICNPENTASRRTCERLGAEYIDTITIPEDNILYESGDREGRRYRIDLTKPL